MDEVSPMIDNPELLDSTIAQEESEEMTVEDLPDYFLKAISPIICGTCQLAKFEVLGELGNSILCRCNSCGLISFIKPKATPKPIQSIKKEVSYAG